MAQPATPNNLAASSVTNPQLLLDAITDYAIYQLDTAGLVCSWNALAQRCKGYAPEDIIGQHFSCFYTDEDKATLLPARALWVATREGKFEDEGWRLRADGSRMWASVVINPIFDAAGCHKGFVKITRDISEKKEAADILREANVAIAHMQKMQSLGRVAGGIAHDFNNLLTAILAAVDNLTVKGQDPAINRSLGVIEMAAEQAARLTSQLLAFARNQPLKPERLSIRECIEDMMPMLESITGAVSLNSVLASDDCVVEIDATQFRAAIVNLVTNAKDAVDAPGTITITTSVDAGIPVIRRHEATAGHYVAVAVTDDGEGIADDIRDKVFEPFFTTKPLFHGTGLGLSQVYGFSKQSGGNVAISSGSGSGTAITLYLPLSRATAIAAHIARVADREGGRREHAILFVEDNRIIGTGVVSALSELGHRVVWLESGEAALEAIAAQPDSFDIVVSDVVMPGMSGVELAKTIRDRFPAMPIILTSGYTEEQPNVDSLGCPFISKPYRIADLLGSMDAALGATTTLQ